MMMGQATGGAGIGGTGSAWRATGGFTEAMGRGGITSAGTIGIGIGTGQAGGEMGGGDRRGGRRLTLSGPVYLCLLTGIFHQGRVPGASDCAAPEPMVGE
jgi:hypothetical protein